MAKLSKTQKRRMLESIKSKAFRLSPYAYGEPAVSFQDFAKITAIVNKGLTKLK